MKSSPGARSSAMRVSGTEEIVQLCDKPAVLGQRLCEAVISLSTTEVEIDAKSKSFWRIFETF